MEEKRLSRSALIRLPSYLWYLKSLSCSEQPYTSARNIAVVIDGKIASLLFVLSKVESVNVYFPDGFEKARKYADMINECVSGRKLD